MTTILLPAWLLALRSVIRDAMRRTRTGPELARCGLPPRVCGPCAAARVLAQLLRATTTTRAARHP